MREVCCDESGYEGDKLIGATTDAFAHAGVLLDAVAARECVRELRDLIRSPATEYKANHLLREKNRRALTWFLDPGGPLAGTARVFLVDKPFYAVVRVVELLVDGSAATAAAVYRWLGSGVPPEHRQAFLVAANDLLRLRNRLETAPVDAFFGMLDVLRRAGPSPLPDEVDETLAKLRAAGPRVDALRAGLVAEPVPLADPLTPAIARAVDHAGGAAVTVVHDRTNTLTSARIAGLERTIPSLAAVRLVASEEDARVQVADFLAGIARRLTQDALDGAGPDPELSGLLRPYLDPASVWFDEHSRASLFTPGRSAPSPGPRERSRRPA